VERSRDRPPVIACAEAAAERVPACGLIRMPGVDHLPSIREPEWVASVILKYAAPG
jgi:3-oxoadipate enol-lactonase